MATLGRVEEALRGLQEEVAKLRAEITSLLRQQEPPPSPQPIWDGGGVDFVEGYYRDFGGSD